MYVDAGLTHSTSLSINANKKALNKGSLPCCKRISDKEWFELKQYGLKLFCEQTDYVMPDWCSSNCSLCLCTCI